MKLGELLDVAELRKLLESRHILMRRHPTLPLAILNYSNECMFEDFWPETVQHCRGLIIDAVAGHEPCDDCNIISRPFHKFFNLNQSNRPETMEASLPLVAPTVTEKMDGWFGILWKINYEGQMHYGIASRGSFESPGAEFGTGKLSKLIKYGAMDEFPAGYTPIFEIIFKQGKIVVDYPFEGLVLLGLVNNETGEEMSYDAMQSVWAKIAGYAADNRPWIRLVKAHRMGLAQVKGIANSWDLKNQEGFVLTYPRPGTWPMKVKVKLEDYKRLHKLITGITPQQIWKSLHDPMAPWLGNEVPDHFREWAMKWRDTLYSEFQKRLATIMADANAVGAACDQMGLSRNDRASVVAGLNHLNPDTATIALSLLDGKIYRAYQSIWDRIRPVGRDTEVFYREGQGE